MSYKVFDFRKIYNRQWPVNFADKKHKNKKEEEVSPVDCLKPPEEEVETRKRPMHGVNCNEQFHKKPTDGKRNTIRLKIVH